MKIPPRQLSEFVKSPPSNCLAVLVYGPDSGQVSEYFNILAEHAVDDVNDPFGTVDFIADDLKDQTERLTDEISAISFGGGRRLIRIKHATNSAASVIKDALVEAGEGAAKDVFVLVSAGELSPSSSLRKWFEQTPFAAALACYVDDERGLSVIAREKLAELGFRADPATIQMLASYCQGDRLLLYKAVEKLALYKGDDKNLDAEDITLCIGEATQAALDDVGEAVLGKRITSIDSLLNKAFAQGAMPISVLRSLHRQLVRIQTVIGESRSGSSLDSAVNSLKPPVFFKRKPAFLKMVRAWGHPNYISRLQKAIHSLYEAELACKTGSMDPEILCERCLLYIASLAPRN